MDADHRSVWTTLAATLVTVGVAVLIAVGVDLIWWTDPIFWIGAVALTAGAFIFLWLLVPPWLTNRRLRRLRKEEARREGRANQREGLDEILRELGQISSQLKGELRWGKRDGLFPNTAWAKNQHLVTGDARALVEDAYEQAHLLDQATISAAQLELDERETQERQHAKPVVDAAAEAVRDLHDEVQP